MFAVILFTGIGCLVEAADNSTQNQLDLFEKAGLNIENHRKTQFLVQIEGINEEELNDITVGAEQISHDFHWQ